MTSEHDSKSNIYGLTMVPYSRENLLKQIKNEKTRNKLGRIFNKQNILSKIKIAPNNADSDKSFRIYIENGRSKICLTIIEYPG